MYEIAKKLIAFGMEFTYEHNGSQGQKIESLELSVSVTIQQGKIYYENCGRTVIYKESDETAIPWIVNQIEQDIIEETT